MKQNIAIFLFVISNTEKKLLFMILMTLKSNLIKNFVKFKFLTELQTI